MPNRILKESICTSDNIDALSSFSEVVFYRLLVNCDDYGRMDGRPKLLAAKLFPLKDIKPDQMAKALDALVSADLIHVYTVKGHPYIQVVTWDQHQIVRNARSKYPAESEADEPDLKSTESNCMQLKSIESNCMQLNANESKCSRNPIQSESNPNPNTEGNRTRFRAPSVDEVNAYAKEADIKIDAQRFFDYYASNGWKVGKNSMKDWHAAVRSWAARDNADPPRPQKPSKIVTEAQYEQRDYKKTDFVGDDGLSDYQRRWLGGEDVG